MPQELSEYFRFCPDQPKILISDAVCLSRRRVNHPWCQGCQFNDDEKKKKQESPGRPQQVHGKQGRPASEPPSTNPEAQEPGTDHEHL